MFTIQQHGVAADEVLVPVDLRRDKSNIFVVAFLLPRSYFCEPFFVDSLAKSFDFLKSQIKLPLEDELLARPVHCDEKDPRVVRIPIDEFIKKHNKVSIDKNLGFVFHMSRCGSTLVAQMLAHNDRLFVLSEPTIINAVLDPSLDITLTDRMTLLNSSVASLVSCSPVLCERVFIKFRSWNILYLDSILKEFPDIRWLFIHRHGLEVLASVLEKPPGWLRSRISYSKYFADFLKIDNDAIRKISEEEFIARMLGVFCHIAAESDSAHVSFIDYINLKDNFFDIIKKQWEIDLVDQERQTMIEISRLYSKDVSKNTPFFSDSEIKMNKATEMQRDFVTKFVENERAKLMDI